SSRRRHTRSKRDWSSDVCSSDLRFVYSAEFFFKLFTAILTFYFHIIIFNYTKLRTFPTNYSRECEIRTPTPHPKCGMLPLQYIPYKSLYILNYTLPTELPIEPSLLDGLEPVTCSSPLKLFAEETL